MRGPTQSVGELSPNRGSERHTVSKPHVCTYMYTAPREVQHYDICVWILWTTVKRKHKLIRSLKVYSKVSAWHKVGILICILSRKHSLIKI